MSVCLGRLDNDSNLDKGWFGFSLGAKAYYNDYRDSAIRGNGLDVGITTAGKLFIAGLMLDENREFRMDPLPLDDIKLRATRELRGGFVARTLSGVGVAQELFVCQ